MNSLPELELNTYDQQAEQLPCAERLDDYLDHLGAPLIGIVPYPERKALRQEVHAHIDGLIRECLWQGQSLQEATETALREFGEPWNVGQAFLQEWLQGSPTLRPATLIRNATLTAFAWFGIASVLTLLLLERYLLAPTPDALLPVIGLVAFLAPFVAGALVGAMSPAQAERGVRNAVWFLVMHSFVTGLILEPRHEGLAIAGWQLIFWLPAGRLSAGMTAACLRQARRQRFWLIAR